jgi:alpha-tubulin suppressor-like RCC1 family protein
MMRRIAVIALLVAGCGGIDLQGPRGQDARHSDPSLQAGVAVSGPTASAATTDSTGFTIASLSASPPVYVSLVPGTATGAMGAMIVNLRTGDTTKLALQNGGFDPVPIAAEVGDSIQVSAIVRYAGTVDAFFLVAADTPPLIVRTNPPRGQTDVPVNTNIIVVFSEPVDPASLNTSSVVLTAGGAAVAGAVRLLSTSALIAEFIPDATLTGSTEYVLSVSRAVTDVSGHPLNAATSVAFSTAPAPAATVLTFASISAGIHTCGLTPQGKAYCWGHNSYGQLGDGTVTDRHLPIAVAGGLTFAFVSVSSAHTCALTLTGAAYCWGSNSAGQLGNGTFANSSVPVPVAGGLSFTSINSAGATCAVTTSGAAYCWGANAMGMIGAVAGANCASPGCTVPVKVDGGIAFATVTVGAYTTCGVTPAGTGYCWGLNGYGELGSGDASGPEQCATFSQYHLQGAFPDAIPCSRTPVAVATGAPLHAVTAGGFFACGLIDSGAAYCWGVNNTGQFGDGTTAGMSAHPSPAAAAGNLRFRALNPGNQRICGIALDGQTYCWGGNYDGEAGALGCRQGGGICNVSTPNLVPGGFLFVSITTGGGHACGLTGAGKAYCWGNNVYGELGNNSVAPSFVPVAVGPQQ